MTFSKKNHSTPLHSTPLHSTPLHSTPLHSTHSTELFKIFFSLLTLSTAFLQKASGPGKNEIKNYKQYIEDLNIDQEDFEIILNKRICFYPPCLNKIIGSNNYCCNHQDKKCDF